MTVNKNYKNINDKWVSREMKKQVKYTIKNHPWCDTNSFVKVKQERIWTSLITPENQR